MAEIFISYAREDGPTAEKFAKLFEELAYTVWWDSELITGKDWEEQLRRQIDKAKCVVVLWSKHSVTSEYVFKEADIAIEENKLFPVLIGNVPIPPAFERIQTADLKLSSRKIDPSTHKNIAKIVNDIVVVIGQPARVKAEITKTIIGLIWYGIIGYVLANSILVSPTFLNALGEVIRGDANASLLLSATLGPTAWAFLGAAVFFIGRLMYKLI